MHVPGLFGGVRTGITLMLHGGHFCRCSGKRRYDCAMCSVLKSIYRLSEGCRAGYPTVRDIRGNGIRASASSANIGDV